MFCGLQPTVPANQAAALAGHPDWREPARLPVRTLRLVSDAPLPPLRAGDLTLHVSDDNRTYRPYRGTWRLSVSRQVRAHARWSPAGPRPDGGRRACWVLELADLNLRHRFVALRWQREDLRIRGRAFAMVEGDDAAGHALHATLARAGSCEKGFHFYGPRRAWSNHSEPITDSLELGPRDWGLLLAPIDRLPPILEPCDERTHDAWLRDMQTHIDRGVDGIDLRFLCHHVDCQDWGSLAFSAAVRQAFAQAHGRAPEPTEQDLHRVRLLRGQGVTRFLRRARQLTRRHRVKLIIHLESGMDVPPHLHTRNQIHMDWRTWLRERLVDEVMLKYFTSQHPLVMEQIVPLARAQDIAVHACEINIHSLYGPHAVERLTRLAQQARSAGLAGLTLYETAGYQWVNRYGGAEPIGNIHHAVAAASRATGGGED
jgi:hypothetical protein